MTPLTRRDLAELLEQIATRPTRDEIVAILDQRLEQRLANYATRDELEAILDQRFANYATRDELDQRLADQRTQIAADTRATMTVLLEDAFKRFRVIDDQYKDLPARVRRLEDAVFPPPPARTRRRRSG